MFIQMIQGRTRDGRALRERFDVWARDHAGEAAGWSGTTAGITDEGDLVAVVQFASEDEARRNSDRPEQGRWWRRTQPLFAGTVDFDNFTSGGSLFGGGPADAGFVQVIRGRTSDVGRLQALQADFDKRLGALRPEIVGGTYAWNEEGGIIQTVYFTSEEEAREGERRMLDTPEPIRARFEEYARIVTDLRYFDLREPWLWRP
jgi:hypothetical protein